MNDNVIQQQDIWEVRPAVSYREMFTETVASWKCCLAPHNGLRGEAYGVSPQSHLRKPLEKFITLR